MSKMAPRLMNRVPLGGDLDRHPPKSPFKEGDLWKSCQRGSRHGGRFGINNGGRGAASPHKGDPLPMLKAGFSSRCITPPPGCDIPGLFERRIARGVHDDLFVRAVVIDDGTRCVALVQTDAITAP